jgi:hypothetical protein
VVCEGCAQDDQVAYALVYLLFSPGFVVSRPDWPFAYLLYFVDFCPFFLSIPKYCLAFWVLLYLLFENIAGRVVSLVMGIRRIYFMLLGCLLLGS